MRHKNRYFQQGFYISYCIYTYKFSVDFRSQFEIQIIVFKEIHWMSSLYIQNIVFLYSSEIIALYEFEVFSPTSCSSYVGEAGTMYDGQLHSGTAPPPSLSTDLSHEQKLGSFKNCLKTYLFHDDFFPLKIIFYSLDFI